MLDIGCGTGLLSMLAVRAGAKEVYGCELYEPLAVIAREVTELNCTGKIKACIIWAVQCYASMVFATRSCDLLNSKGVRKRRIL